MESKKEIILTACQPADMDLWEKWKYDVDFSKYQTHLLPENYGAGEVDYKLFMICFGSNKIGAIWLEKIDYDKKTGWIGLFIGDTQYWNKGIGGQAISLILDYAFIQLRLNSVWLNVREQNLRAVRCYEKAGFKIVNKCGPKQFNDNSYQCWYEMMIENE